MRGTMKVTIFDLRETNSLDTAIEEIMKAFKERYKNITFESYNAEETELKNCIGCWSCWWKTPGKCALPDTVAKRYQDYMSSDEVVLLFDTRQGFISAKGKTFLDRMIQLFLPYIHMRNGESGHIKRYEKYPVMNFYLEKDGLNEKEIAVIKNYLARTAYHFQSDGRELVYDEDILKFCDLNTELPTKDDMNSLLTERTPTGKWVIYNGSPRGVQSNSRLLIEQIILGMHEKGISNIEVRDLYQLNHHKAWADDFTSNENNLFVFPLYVHAMPGLVMKFFEQLKPVDQKEVHIAYFIQSGFPETSQSYYLKPYLELLTDRLGAKFDGILIKGGVEGIQMKPEKANQQLFDQMKQLGVTYAQKGIIDISLISEYKKEEQLSKFVQILFTILRPTGLPNFYWDYNLKKNGAFKMRFAKPYIE